MSVSLYDPACDQCRLKKIRCGREQPKCHNCQRSGVPCGFSERGKRSSQSRLVFVIPIHSTQITSASAAKRIVMLLVSSQILFHVNLSVLRCAAYIESDTDSSKSSIDNLEGVKSRLDSIDETISDFKSIIEGITTKLSPLNPSVSSVSIVEQNEAGDLGRVESLSDQSALTTIRHLVNEQYYGSSSLVSLLSEIQSLLEDRVREDEDCSMGDGVVGSDESLGECLAVMGDIAKSLIVDDPLDLSNDGLPLALPPKGLLDAFIEPYFNQVNWMLPVFRKDAFCENVRKNYEAGSGKANSAWILCFNNVILQTMNVRALGFSSKPEDMESNMHGDAMEAELLRPFLINSRRGLNKLERFVEPKLINVQELISMVGSPIRCSAPVCREAFCENFYRNWLVRLR